MKLIIILSAVIIILLVLLVFAIVKLNSTKKVEQSVEIKTEIQSGHTKTSNSKSTKRKKNTYRKTQKMKWNDKMLDISMIPKTVELDHKTLLPQAINRQYGYGRRFNTFIVDDNQYHRSTCNTLKGKKKQLVHRYAAICNLPPCPDCAPVSYIDDWYIEFIQKNFGKFTSYEDFNANLRLPIVKIQSQSIPQIPKAEIINTDKF